jgi:hypothetical protein
VATTVIPILAVVLCVQVLLAARADWEWAVCPWPWWAWLRGSVWPLLGLLFFGLAAASLPTRWNRAVVLLVGLGVLGDALRRHAWLAWPEAHGDQRVAGSDHHLQQSSHYTCGPAACAAALSHLGIVASERDLAAACLTRREGTSLFDLYRGLVLTLGDRPIEVSIEAVDADRIVADQMLVVGATAGLGHAICIAARAGQLVVHDPLRPAPQRVTAAALRELCGGPAIVLRPRAAAAPAR